MQKIIFAVIISITIGLQLQPVNVSASSLAQSKDPAMDCGMGILALLASNSSQAKALLEPAFETLQANPSSDKDLLLSCGLNLAVLLQAELEWNRALEVYEYLLPITREVDDQQSEWTVRFGMGSIYMAQERYDQAETMLEEALNLSRSSSPWFLENIKPTAQAATLNNLALSLAGLERRKLRLDRDFSEAHNLLQEALTASRQKNDQGLLPDLFSGLGVQSLEPVILNNIGQLYSDEAQYELAITHFEEALARNAPGGNGFMLPGPEFNQVLNGVIYNNLGLVYFRQSEPETALQYFEQALEIMQESENPLAQAGVLTHVGFIKEQQGQLTEALAAYEASIQLREEAQAVVDSGLVTSVGGGQLSNSNALALTGSLGAYSDVYDYAVHAYYKAGVEAHNQGDLTESRHLLAQSFYTSERNRARLFLNLLTARQLQLADATATALLQQERAVFSNLIATRRNLAILSEENGAANQIQQLKAELTGIEQVYQEILTAIQTHDPELMSLISGQSNVLTVTEVQALLDEDTTLVSYYTLGDESILAFIISSDDFTIVDMADLSRLKIREQLNTWLRDLRINEKNLEIAHPQELQTIYQELINPILNQIQTRKLGLVAHNELHYIPFAGLSDGNRYLSEQFILFSLPSASTLPFVQAQLHSADKVAPPLILGDPILRTEVDLEPLHFAQREAENIGAILDAPVYLADQATESLIWQEADTAGTIHVSAHGEFDQRIPLDSSIELAEGDGHDGSLKVREIFDLKLPNVELVTLSACQTSLAQSVTSDVGSISAGDEIVSLNRAFFYAGAPTILSSLWSVDDESTEFLMTEFYRQWKQQGMSKAEALQAAQNLVREQYPNPYFWAAFVLSGDD
ncbi:MAG TPA: CHAT domain-containing protein [Anaerolineae bacterium]|nr:CHAT domain-containing protein [Anaerolineae bacterium]